MAKKSRGRGDSGKKQTVFGGLSKSRYGAKGQFADRLELKTGSSADVQFLAPIDDPKVWKEIYQHQFNDGGWKYVPCLGDDCPLCEDEDRDVSKTTYRFFTLIWSFKDKKIVIMEGPKTLSGAIARKFERAEKKTKGAFLKQTFEINKIDSTPVTYEVERSDRKAVKVDLAKEKNLPDLDTYIQDQITRYYGDDLPKSAKKKKGKEPSRSAMDDDDDYDEDGYSEEELEEMDWSDLKKYAKSLGVKLVDKEGNKRKRPALIRLILKKTA